MPLQDDFKKIFTLTAISSFAKCWYRLRDILQNHKKDKIKMCIVKINGGISSNCSQLVTMNIYPFGNYIPATDVKDRIYIVR